MTKTNAYKTVWQVLFLIEQTELLSSAPMVFSINPPPLWYNKEWWHWDRMMLNIQWSSPLMVSSTHFQHELQFFLHFFSSREDFQFLEENYYILHSWMQLLDMGLQTQNINQKCFVFRNLLSVQKIVCCPSFNLCPCLISPCCSSQAALEEIKSFTNTD